MLASKKAKTSGNYLGQAVIEYLIIFAFMGLFGVRLVGTFNVFLNDTVTGLAYAISQHLTIGVCEKQCFFGKYGN